MLHRMCCSRAEGWIDALSLAEKQAKANGGKQDAPASASASASASDVGQGERLNIDPSDAPPQGIYHCQCMPRNLESKATLTLCWMDKDQYCEGSLTQ